MSWRCHGVVGYHVGLCSWGAGHLFRPLFFDFEELFRFYSLLTYPRIHRYLKVVRDFRRPDGMTDKEIDASGDGEKL